MEGRFYDDRIVFPLFHKHMFAFFSNRTGCVGSLIISVIGTILLAVLLRACAVH